jgi:hypothetical protein
MADLGTYGPDYTGAGSCAGTAGSNDMAYKITVAPGQLLNMTVTPDVTFDPTISVSESAAECDVTCVQTVDVGFEGDPETLSYKNTTTSPKTLFLVIDGYGVGGPITVTSSLVTPPPDDTCAQPAALTTGTPLTGQTITNYSNDYQSFAATCAFDTGPDRVYGVNIPAGMRLTVVATPQTTSDPSLSLVDGAANCDMTCVAYALSAGTGGVEKMQFTNNTGGAKDYLLVVDFGTGNTGTFDLTATIDQPPADDVCQAPTSLTAGVAATAGTTENYTNDYQNGTGTVGCATTGALGPDRVYQISVPATQRATVTVTPTTDGGFNPSINFVEGPATNCSAMPRVCAGGSNLGGTNAPEVARITNASAGTKTYFAIVDSTTPPGPFTIGYTTATPPADDTCGTTTTVLTAGTRATESLAAFAPDYTSGTGCRSSNGPDRGYKVTLAANEKIGVTVTPTGGDAGIDAVVNFVAGPAANCEATPRVCRGGTNAVGVGLPESSAYTNNSGASQEVFLLVADFQTTTMTPGYSLTTTIGASPAGESCQNPATLGVTTATTGDTTGASNDVVFNTAASASCTSITRPDRVYAITLPASKVLTVTATPNSTEDLLLNLIDSPATSCNDVQACLQTADVGFSSDPEVLTYTNGATAKTVFLQVSAYSNNAKYSLAVTIQ